MSFSLQGIADQLPPENIIHSTEEYSQGSSMEPGDSSLPSFPPSLSLTEWNILMAEANSK